MEIKRWVFYQEHPFGEDLGVKKRDFLVAPDWMVPANADYMIPHGSSRKYMLGDTDAIRPDKEGDWRFEELGDDQGQVVSPSGEKYRLNFKVVLN